MKKAAIVGLVLACACAALASFQTITVREAVTPTLATYSWGGTPLSEVVVADLEDNEQRMAYIRSAASRQYTLVQLYSAGEIVKYGHTFTATSGTITDIKLEFAALRTRIKACEDLVTAQ